MKAGDIMTAGAATVRVDATVAHAARTMLEHRVSGLPVVDAAGMLVGIVTELDLLRRTETGTERHRPKWVELWVSPRQSAEEYVHARTRKISDVMTPDVVAISPETALDEVISIMEKKGYKRLPVVRDGRIVGIISRANFLLALSHRMEGAATGPVDDLVIRRGILDEIEAQRWSPLAMVDVEVKQGAVHLRGTVSDEPVRRAVVVAAENTRGVTEVTDSLSVVPFVTAGI